MHPVFVTALALNADIDDLDLKLIHIEDLSAQLLIGIPPALVATVSGSFTGISTDDVVTKSIKGRKLLGISGSVTAWRDSSTL